MPRKPSAMTALPQPEQARVEALPAIAPAAGNLRFDSFIALVMIVAGIMLMTSCDVESSNLGNVYSGPSAEVYFNNSALPDGRIGAVDSFEAQYAGRTFRGRMTRTGDSWVAALSGVVLNTTDSIEFRIMAKNQIVYQAFQSDVRFADQQQVVRIADCNVRQGWSGTVHQNSCRWTIR